MAVLATIMILAGLLGILVFLIFIIVQVIRRKPKKKAVIFLLISIILVFTGLEIAPAPENSIPTSTATATLSPSDTPLPSATPSPTATITLTPVILTYYDYNENINKYVNRFNEVNPDYQLSSDDLSVYYHHGQYHTNQAKINRDGFDISITDKLSSIKIVLKHYPRSQKSIDDFEQQFIRFALPYSSELSEEKLSDYWNQLLDALGNRIQFEEFEVDITMYNEKIDYIVIDDAFRKRK